ncbi:MAG: FtsQ-type POTRA domain-containing protein [Pseudomonadota bacterium]
MSGLSLPMAQSFGRSPRAEAGAIGEGLPPVLLRIAVSVLAVLATYALGGLVMQRFDAPVREIAITGALRNVRPDEVRAAAMPLIEAGKLFTLNLDAIRTAIERLPWVAHARIDRQWPARLAVRITEREPFARWGGSDALSTEGIVFAPGSVLLSSTLPKLGGAPGREREVMAMYGQLADRLSETPFALAGLTQDARGEWIGSTQNGISLRFGRSTPVEQVARLKNTVLPALASRLDSVQRIDLRYANGFAVGWRDASETLHRPQAGQSSSSLAAPAPDATAPDAVPGATP